MKEKVVFSSVFNLYCSPVPLEVFFLSTLFVRLLPCLTSIDDFLLSVGKSKEAFTGSTCSTLRRMVCVTFRESFLEEGELIGQEGGEY